ncbi:MAG TPA: Fe-S cluster assembly protein SufD [Acidimicrobiales bacterium]|nr:Fe-S cluster assembly protein SufD [Acidimicrobiales bacterium]
MDQFGPDVAAALPGAGWLRNRRVGAAERFASASLPTEAEEIWRYSRIGQFDIEAYTPATSLAMSGHHGIPPVLEAAITVAGERSALVIVHGGRIVHTEVDPALEARGLAIGDIGADADGDDVLGDVAASATDAFTELNTAFAPGCVGVRVPAGLEVERPILVFHWIDAEGSAVFPRTIVRAGADSEVTVVEHQVSTDVAAFVDPVVEIDLAPAARVNYLTLQDLGPRVWQTGYQASRVAQDATLRSSVVALGGHYARVRTDSSLAGKGGTSYLTAVYFADGERMHDFRTIQDHVAPSTTSDLLFKGAVQDTGRSVYSGLIRVGKEARGTNAFQTNRNLVLSEGAGAESVPNLEIETDDVRCSHASAVGPIDDEHLYYLESRGVPPDVAERLIVLGFFGEVLDRLPTPTLVDTLRATIAGRLASKSADPPEVP